MPAAKKDLYVGKSLGDLNKQAELPADIGKKGPTVLVKSADTVYRNAYESELLGDEEMAYVLYMRYLDLYKAASKTAEFKKQKDFYNTKFGLANVSKALAEAERLSASLQNRYDLRDAQLVAAKLPTVDTSLPDAPTLHPGGGDDDLPALPRQGSNAAAVNGSTAARQAPGGSSGGAATVGSAIVPGVGSGAGLAANGRAPATAAPAAATPKGTTTNGGSEATVLITCEQLYSLLYGDGVSEGVLVMDMRSPADYAESHIRHKACINVPSQIVPSGGTVRVIEPALPADSLPLWRTRGSCGHIVLLDANSSGSDCLNTQPQLLSLKNAIFKYDQQVIVQSEPLVLDGGYDRWLRFYPQYTTNASVAAAARSLPAGGGRPVTGFLLNAVTIEYPDFEDTLQPVPHRADGSPGAAGSNGSAATNGEGAGTRAQQPAPAAGGMPAFDRSKKPVAGPRTTTGAAAAIAAASAPAPSADAQAGANRGFASVTSKSAAELTAATSASVLVSQSTANMSGTAKAQGEQAASSAAATVAASRPSFDRGNKPRTPGQLGPQAGMPDSDAHKPGSRAGPFDSPAGPPVAGPALAEPSAHDRSKPSAGAVPRLSDEETSLERIQQIKTKESQAVAGLLRQRRQLEDEVARLQQLSIARERTDDEREEDEWARRLEAKRALQVAEERLRAVEHEADAPNAVVPTIAKSLPLEQVDGSSAGVDQPTSLSDLEAAAAAAAGRPIMSQEGAASTTASTADDVQKKPAADVDRKARPPADSYQPTDSAAAEKAAAALLVAEKAWAAEAERTRAAAAAAAAADAEERARAAAAAASQRAVEEKARLAAAAESAQRVAAEKARSDELARAAAAAQAQAAAEERARATERARAEEKARAAAAADEQARKAAAAAAAERAQAEERARAEKALAEERAIAAARAAEDRRRTEEKAQADAAARALQQRQQPPRTVMPAEPPRPQGPSMVTAAAAGLAARPGDPASPTSGGDVHTQALSNKPSSAAMKRSRSQPNLDRLVDGGGADGDAPVADALPLVDRALKPPAAVAAAPLPPPAAEQPQPAARASRSRSIKTLTAEHLRHFEPEYGRSPAGLTGLYNMGNTCYLNSVLQCLSNTAPITAFFTNDDYAQHINEVNREGTGGTVASEFALLLKVLWDGNYRCITPRQFKGVVGRLRPRFAGFQQQDCQELLIFLLDALHEDLNTAQAAGVRLPPPSQAETAADNHRSDEEAARAAWEDHKLRNQSIITQLFQGQFRSTVTCSRCGWKSRKFDVFQYLALEIPSNVSRCSVQDCLRMYLREEKIDGFKCEKCKNLVTASKKIDIWYLPPILMVFFKRFKNGFYVDEFSKVSTTIDFPLDALDMGTVAAAASSPASRSKPYSLFAVANHYGTMNSGHYTACCKNPVSQSWYKFNDETVSPISPSDVKSAAAYVLFYANIHMKLTV